MKKVVIYVCFSEGDPWMQNLETFIIKGKQFRNCSKACPYLRIEKCDPRCPAYSNQLSKDWRERVNQKTLDQ